MNEISILASVLSGIKNATDLVKLLNSSDNNLKELERRELNIDLSEELANIKLAFSELSDEINSKNNEIEALKKSHRLSAKLSRFKNAYYEINHNGELVGDSYCESCLELLFTAVHLVPRFDKTGFSLCPNCNTRFPPQRLPSDKAIQG